MKLFNKSLAAAAAFAMVAAPVVASAANPAAKLSLNKSSRAGTVVRSEGSKLEGSSTILAIGAAILVVVGIILAADGSKSP